MKILTDAQTYPKCYYYVRGVFVLRPLSFLSRGNKTQAWSSDYILTKLILQLGCPF